jgi:hypothetical protein
MKLYNVICHDWGTPSERGKGMTVKVEGQRAVAERLFRKTVKRMEAGNHHSRVMLQQIETPDRLTKHDWATYFMAGDMEHLLEVTTLESVGRQCVAEI